MAALGDMTPGKLKILKAVATLLEDPSAKVTISRIARTISVTDAAIYRHYKSKEEIFAALMSYMESNFLSPLNTAQSSTQNTSQRLEMVFYKYMEFLAGHPGLSRLFLGHGSHEAAGMAERMKLLHAKLRTQISQMLKFGQAQGEIVRGVEPDAATELFYGLITAAAMAQGFGFPQVDAAGRWEVFRTAMLTSASASRAA